LEKNIFIMLLYILYCFSDTPCTYVIILQGGSKKRKPIFNRHFSVFLEVFQIFIYILFKYILSSINDEKIVRKVLIIRLLGLLEQHG